MGKLTVITVVALIVLGVGMVCVWGKVSAVLLLAGLALFALFVAFFWIDRTLQRYPQLALLDGTELVDYRKVELEMAAKAAPPPLPADRVPTLEPGKPHSLPPGSHPEEPDR